MVEDDGVIKMQSEPEDPADAALENGSGDQAALDQGSPAARNHEVVAEEGISAPDASKAPDALETVAAHEGASPRADEQRGSDRSKKERSDRHKSSRSGHKDRSERDSNREEERAERSERKARRGDRERDRAPDKTESSALQRDSEQTGRSARERKDRPQRERDAPSRDDRRESRSSVKDSSNQRRRRSRSADRKVSKSDRKDDRDKEQSSSRKQSRSRSRGRRNSRLRSSSRHRRSRSRSRSRGRDRKHRSRSRRSRSGDRSSRRRPTKPASSEEDDGLGGYMPRKRQEPPREGVWSLAAAAYSGSSYMDPYAAMRSRSTMNPEEMKRQMQEQQLKARQLVLAQQASSAVAAASKTQREVYIGNLVGGMVTEDALRQLFNNTMAAAFPDQMVNGLDAVVNVSMHSEGRYSFVELRTPEMATAALQLSGQVQLLGQPISVGRPSGYVDPAAAQNAAVAAAKALEAFQAGEASVEEAGAAGMPSAAPSFGVNPGMTPPPSTATGSSVPDTATAFLVVSGMVTVETLADDEEYSEVLEDLKDECSKFGDVVAISVPRPADPSTSAAVFNTGSFGKGFVHFKDVSGAIKAREAIHGRLFAGITVQALFVDEDAFKASKA